MVKVGMQLQLRAVVVVIWEGEGDTRRHRDTLVQAGWARVGWLVVRLGTHTHTDLVRHTKMQRERERDARDDETNLVLLENMHTRTVCV